MAVSGIAAPWAASAIVAAPLQGTDLFGLQPGTLSVGAGASILASTKGSYEMLSVSGADSASYALNLTAYSALTVMGWVKASSWATGGGQYNMVWEFTPDGYSNGGGFSFYNEGAAGWTLAHYGGAYNVRQFGTGSRSSGVWTHFAAVYDFTQAAANEMKLYINGASVSVASAPVSNETSSSSKFANNTLYLMSRTRSSLVTTGDMTGFVIVAGALSLAEIQSIYNDSWSLYSVTGGGGSGGRVNQILGVGRMMGRWA